MDVGMELSITIVEHYSQGCASRRLSACSFKAATSPTLPWALVDVFVFAQILA
jgi:hypothetical protein